MNDDMAERVKAALAKQERQTKAENDTLSPRQARFVAAILTAPSVRDAAKRAEIGEKTAWRYLKNSAVKAAISGQVDSMLTMASAQGAQDLVTALATLRAVMATGAEPQRVAAAGRILANVPRIIEQEDILERLAKLEEQNESNRAKN